MSVIGSIPGPVKGDVDLHEPASVGTLGPVSVDAGVQEHVSIPVRSVWTFQGQSVWTFLLGQSMLNCL